MARAMKLGGGGGARGVPRRPHGEEALRGEPELAARRADPEDGLEAPESTPTENLVGGIESAASGDAERRVALELGANAEGLGEVVAHAQAVAQARAARVASVGSSEVE